MAMVRKYLSVILTAFAMQLVMLQPAKAQLVAGVSFDFPADAVAAMAPVFEQLQTIKDEVISYKRKLITDMKAKLSKYLGKPKTIIGKVPAKKMAEKSSVDIYDAEAVQAAVKELFLQYPSNEPYIKGAYEEKAQQFYYDTLIEMTMSASIVEKNFGNMRANIQKIEKDASDPENSGGASSAPTEDENGNYYNLYLLNREFNKILRVTEEVMAMYAQYYTAQAIYLKKVVPAEYDEGSKKKEKKKDKKTSSLMFRETVAFAQMMSMDTVSAPKQIAVSKGLQKEVLPVARTVAVEAAPSTKAKSELSVSAPKQIAVSKGLRKEVSPVAGTVAAKAVPAAEAKRNLSVSAPKQIAVSKSLQKAVLPEVQAKPALATVAKDKVFDSATKQVSVAQDMQKAVAPEAEAGADEATSAAEDDVSEEVAQKMPTIGGVEFSAIKKADMNSPLYESREKLDDLVTLSEAESVLNKALEVHNTLQLMPTYRNLFKQYELFKRLHQKSVEAVAASDQCVIEYLGRRYKKPATVWYGSETPPAEVADYDIRNGLSGWAISAYQVANSFKTAGLDTDSFIPSTDTLDVDEENLLDTSEAEAKMAQKNKEGTKQNLANSGDAQEFSDTVREVELLTWQIGAEAARILAADQYADKPAYGQAQNPYPVWQDQKNFYNLYLSEKYDNIIEYIRKADLNSMILDIAKIINEDQADTEAGKSYASYLGVLEQNIKKGSSSNRRVASLSQQKESSLALLKASKQKEKQAISAETAKFQKQVNDLSQEIKELSDEILTVDSSAKEADFRAEQSHNELREMRRRGTDTESLLYAESAAQLEQGKTDSVVYRQKTQDLKDELEIKKQKLQQHITDLEKAQEKEKEFDRAYLAEADIIGTAATAEIDKEVRQSSKAVSLTDIAKSKKINVPGFLSLIGKATGLVDDARDEAIELVSQAKQDILNMGDSLYDPREHARVVNRHRQLISSLKELPRKNLLKNVASLAISNGKASIVSLLASIFNQPVSKACSKVSCGQPDSEYFVGYPAKERDFVAPKEPLSEHYPPVHDIVHFDYDDYKNLWDRSNNSQYLTKEAFENWEMPTVWKMILLEKPFVEKELDLGRLLRNNNGEEIAFVRGVRYPCLYQNKYVVDVSGGSRARYLISRDIQKEMPVCRDVDVTGTVLFYTVYDLESYDEETNTYLHDQAETQKSSPKLTPSELGTLFKVTEKNKIEMNGSAKPVFERIAVLNDASNQNSDFKYTLRDTLFHKAMYKENQIGNFLHFVDKENSVRKNVEEMAVSIEDARQSIITMLNEMGFSVNPDFNLAKDEDYTYIQKKLDEYKNSLVGTASGKIAEVDYNDEVIKERYDKINNVRAALVQDAEELIVLHNGVSAGSTLDEEILTEQVNQKVIKETQKAGEEAILKEIEHFEKPLCVVY